MADGIKKINEWTLKDGRVIGITKEMNATKFEGGTLLIVPNRGELKYNNIDSSGTKSWRKFSPVNIFEQNSIVSSLIQNNAITESKIADGSITTPKIKDLAVNTNKISDNAITTPKIDNKNVTTEKLADYCVTEFKLKDDSVGTTKLKNLSVTTDKIAIENILNTHIANNTIRNEKLLSKTITHDKIADKTIVESLLADRSVTSKKIAIDSVISEHIGASQVRTQHLLDRNVTGNKIALNSLKNEHFMINSVNGDKLLDGSITTSKYNDLSITNQKIANGSIDLDKIEELTKALITEAIRVEGSNQTATVKGNLKVNGNINATGDITGARVYNPVFADIAEAYIPTEKLEPGDAVCLSLKGDLKIEKLNKSNTNRFLGFVSNEYASLFGATKEEIDLGYKIPVCLVGRIKIKVPKEFEFNIGEYLHLLGDGRIKAFSQKTSTSFGRVLESKRVNEDKEILCQLYP